MNLKLVLRYIIFIVGLFLCAVGIALTIKSGIGSTPVSVVPLVFSETLPLTFGQMNFILSLSFVVMQIPLLGKMFKKEQYLQFLVCPFFGAFIDFGLFLFRDLLIYSYFIKLIVLLIGCIMLGLGVYLQVVGDVIINPGEGIVRAIAYRMGIKLGNAKISFDVIVMILGIILSYVFLGKIIGVGEGTLILALFTGSVVKVFKWVFDHFDINRLYD